MTFLENSGEATVAGAAEVIERPNVDGTVYFLRAGDFIKIGFTSGCADERAAALQTGNPFPVQVLGTSRGGRWLEKRLHRQFEHARAHGEWFRSDPDVLSVVKAFCVAGI